MAFTFEKPIGFKFRAGQHVRMTLIDPPERDDQGDTRFYSLACSPQDLDLAIAMRMRDTAFKRVLAALPIGGKVKIEILLNVPPGAFALHEDSKRPAVMLAGGIGIVPAYSMINDAMERRLGHTITLFYVNRRPEDAAYLRELQTLAETNSNFTLVATMTRPETSSQSWHGESGRIDRAMLDRRLKQDRKSIFYIAGLPEMVAAAKTSLKALKINAARIKAEEFSGFDGKGTHDMRHRSLGKPIGIGLVLIVIAAIALHLGILAVVFPHIVGLLDFKNPILYAVGAVILIVIAIKLKFAFGGHRK
ncbi:FAD-dependent oxidoreductase [Asticcacaulis sp. EMRT-3]|uniref:FAD-dependent oxidoreductase n=1 Tax=Asticcacaulis sp. EMRT-3 TaxID=3040349 RepID=UPI0024AE9A00|nr:FAD-dependent oxidoreductase [Asticcacaulis sp. EMRT-3]MDI7776544.1 FAD-dependent oxidoreductase [Asticcacaulis sp. EMRT-3]